MKTAKDPLKERYDEYAARFVEQDMEPMSFAHWIDALFSDREMWERHQ